MYMIYRYKLLSQSVLKELSIIYLGRPAFDPVSYELIYQGTREQLKEAVKTLEVNGVKYTVDGTKDIYMVILKIKDIYLEIID